MILIRELSTGFSIEDNTDSCCNGARRIGTCHVAEMNRAQHLDLTVARDMLQQRKRSRRGLK
jgi:hypothetical protein